MSLHTLPTMYICIINIVYVHAHACSTIQSGGGPPPAVIMDRPGQDDDLDDDDHQYVVEDSTPLAPPSEEAFPSIDEQITSKPEG